MQGGFMALTGAQRLGAVLGFIPVISTIVGVIKAFVYFGRANNHETEIKEVQDRLNAQASNVHQKAQTIFHKDCINQIKNAEYQAGIGGLIEIFPGLNIVGASITALDAEGYRGLSKAQGNLERLKQKDSSALGEYLLERYKVTAPADEAKKNALIDALELIYVNLDNIDEQNRYTRSQNELALENLAYGCKYQIESNSQSGKKTLISVLDTTITTRERIQSNGKAPPRYIERTEKMRNLRETLQQV